MKTFSGGIYVIAIISGISGILFGYDTGVISGAILYIETEFGLNSFMKEFVVSAVLIGALIGAFMGGSLADRYGRRKMIIVAAIVFGVGAIGTSLTPDVVILIIGRIIVGIAIGMASTENQRETSDFQSIIYHYWNCCLLLGGFWIIFSFTSGY